MSVLIRGVKTTICELGRLLKWVESACSVSVFLNALFLTSKHLLPAASVDKLPSYASSQTNGMFNSPPCSVTVLAAGQASTVMMGEK